METENSFSELIKNIAREADSLGRLAVMYFTAKYTEANLSEYVTQQDVLDVYEAIFMYTFKKLYKQEVLDKQKGGE